MNTFKDKNTSKIQKNIIYFISRTDAAPLNILQIHVNTFLYNFDKLYHHKKIMFYVK